MELNQILLASLAPVIVVVFCGSATGVAQTTGNDDFHSAQTPAEKTLDAILAHTEDQNMFEFILGRPWYDRSKDTGYARFFTSALLKAWSRKEAELVQQNCDGKYINGEICGIDYNPITCGQDVAGSHFYYTLISDAKIVKISATDNQPARTATTYSLIKGTEGWKLNGVDCGAGIKFNTR